MAEGNGNPSHARNPAYREALTGHFSSLYTPERHRIVVEAVAQGASLRQAAALADVGVDALKRWQHQMPALHAEIKAARERAAREGMTLSGQSKLTTEVRQMILDGIGVGMTQRAIAAMVHVGEHTLSDWLNPTNPNYDDDLHAQVEEAKAIQQRANLSVIQQSAVKGTWQAAAWMNERLYPESFALGRARELPAGTADDPIHTTNPLVEEAAALLAERRRELARERLRALGADEPEEVAWQPPQLLEE